MKILNRAIISLFAILLLALLLVLAALPAASSHNCVAGSDDYDLCVLQAAYLAGVHTTPTPAPLPDALTNEPGWQSSSGG